MSDGDGLRRLAPTGALAVGEPPVAVAAILRVTERARPAPGSVRDRRPAEDDESPADARNAAELEATRAAARRAFPRLSEAEVDLALRHSPEEAAPTPSWRDTLALALPLGVGTLWASNGVGLGLSDLLGEALARAAGDGGVPLQGPAVLLGVLVAGTLAVGVGLLLVRLEPVGRLVGAAVHGLAGLGVLWLAATQVDSLEDLLGCLVLLLVTFGVAGALFTAPVRAWFTVEGRAAAGAVPTRPYVAAVAFTNLLVALFVFVVPAFQKMFKEVGVNLPVFTEVLLSAADFCQSYPWLARPALLLAPVALLRLSPRHERPAFQAAVLLGLFLLASTAGALLLPLVELFQKL